MTIEKTHHGLVLAGGALDRQSEIAVYLNGEDMTLGGVAADDDIGFIVRCTTWPPTVNPSTGRVNRKICFGEVLIFACEKEP